MAAAIVAGIGVGAQIGGAILGARSAKRAARKRAQATSRAAAQQFRVTSTALIGRQKRQRQALDVAGRQDIFFSRLKAAQVRIRSGIALARSRSKGQAARTRGGIGGSLSEARSGRTELQAQVNREVESIQFEREARQAGREAQQRDLNAEFFTSLDQARITREARFEGAEVGATAAATSANQQLASSLIGAGFSFATNTAVQDAIGGFFDNAPQSTRTDVVAVKTTTE